MSAHPSIDLVTDAAAIVLQKRPLVPLSTWLTDAIRACGDAELPLQIVTSHDARLTMPLHSLLRPPYLRWVVGHPSCFYDGLTGEVLQFDGAQFVPEGKSAEPFAEASTDLDDVHLWLEFRVRHPAAENTRVGAAVEAVYRALTGAPPSGWGTAEPVARPWNCDAVTELCRERSPEATRICHTGLGDIRAIGTTRVSRHVGGVDEEVVMHVGARPTAEAVEDLVTGLAAHHDLIDMQVMARTGRADLTAAPFRSAPPLPVGMVLGPQAVREVGRDRAFAVPGIAAKSLGHERFPGVWYPLEEAWPLLERLLEHLKPRERADSATATPYAPLREGVWRRERN
ncbi:DUF6177 family protein [Spirillospora sp. CA-255316]